LPCDLSLALHYYLSCLPPAVFYPYPRLVLCPVFQSVPLSNPIPSPALRPVLYPAISCPYVRSCPVLRFPIRSPCSVCLPRLGCSPVLRSLSRPSCLLSRLLSCLLSRPPVLSPVLSARPVLSLVLSPVPSAARPPVRPSCLLSRSPPICSLLLVLSVLARPLSLFHIYPFCLYPATVLHDWLRGEEELLYRFYPFQESATMTSNRIRTEYSYSVYRDFLSPLLS
jgi:hypothetical protein